MKLYLSSYKLGNSNDKLKDWIKSNGSKIIVIPNAADAFPDGENKTSKIIQKAEELKECGFEYEILDLREYFGKYDELVKKIGDTKAFYVIGGNVFILREAMMLSGFDNFLKEISSMPDYLYAGFSAGICVLSNDLHGYELVDDSSLNPYNLDNIIWDGIGLIDYNPIPHYNSPNHPESHLMEGLVKYYQDNNIKYRTLSDGDVIIEEVNNKERGM